MAIAPIYMNGMITATPEVTTAKLSDDNKAALLQSNSETTVAKEAEDHVNQVRSKDAADNNTGETDDSGSSKNEYAGDGGMHRKRKESFGKVVKKQQGGFNITI
ncbi:MAG: hypothetical protein K6G03_05620 [Lachnospiraceae bacterium]|nr:hypothetical protein [Lachnospiraceae bacterium]